MTGKQIEEAKKTLPHYTDRTPEQKKLSDELSCRNMINCCLIYRMSYDFYNSSTNEFGEYAESFIKLLGEETVMRLWNEQIEDFSKATVTHDVYTDSDGVSYNECKWADD